MKSSQQFQSAPDNKTKTQSTFKAAGNKSSHLSTYQQFFTQFLKPLPLYIHLLKEDITVKSAIVTVTTIMLSIFILLEKSINK